MFPFALIGVMTVHYHLSFTYHFAALRRVPTPALPDGIKPLRFHLAKLRQRGSEEVLKGPAARLYPLDKCPE